VRLRTLFATLCSIFMAISTAVADPLDVGSLAQITGSVTGNTAISTGPVAFSNAIEGGFDGAAGVSIVQQNNGDNNLINAAVSVVDLSETVSAIGASSSAIVNTIVSGNTSTFSGSGIILSNIINGAFNGASGVMIVQQNNGHNNAIGAAVSVSGKGGLAALSLVP